MKQKFNQLYLFKLVLSVIFAVGVFFVASSGAHAASFSVTNTGDNGGSNPASGAGTGTLRQAIVDAEAAAGADQINFNIAGAGPHQITLAAGLPFITETLEINGLSQTGSTCNGLSTMPKIQLNLNGNANALSIQTTATGSEVNGLAIANSGASSYALSIDSDDTAVRCNYFGTFNGEESASSELNSDWIRVNADNIAIGGGATDANLSLAKANVAINVTDASDLTVSYNYVGIKIDGSIADPADISGTGLNIASATGSNLTISDNTFVSLYNAMLILPNGNSSPASNITIDSNKVGTNAAGDASGTGTSGGIAIGSAFSTITNLDITNNTIANPLNNQNALTLGVTDGGLYDDVTIEGNYINVSTDGTTALGDVGNNTTGINLTGLRNSSVSNNVIYATGGTGRGIEVAQSEDTSFQSNIIGLKEDKSSCFSNFDGIGIYISSSINLTVGGTGVGEGNTICTSTATTSRGVLVTGDDAALFGNIITSGGKAISLTYANPWTPPTIISNLESGGDTEVTFITPGSTGNFRIEFFGAASYENSNGFGQAEEFLGYSDVTSTGAPNEQFTQTITGTGHSYVRATLTPTDGSPNGYGNTSELGGIAYRTDLEVDTTDGVSSVFDGTTGHQITQTIVNNGPSIVTNLAFSLDDVACFDVDTIVPSGGATDTGSYDTNASSWSGELLQGESLILTFTGDVTCGPGNNLTLNHTITGIQNGALDVTDTDNSNESYSDTTSIIAYIVDLAVTKTLNNPEDYLPGETVNFTLSLRNDGPQPFDLTQLNGSDMFNPFADSLVEMLPDDLTFGAVTSPDADCDDFAPASATGSFLENHLNYNIIKCFYTGGALTLNDGDSFDIDFSVTIANDSELKTTNFAMAPAGQNDPDLQTSDCFNVGGAPGGNDFIDCLVEAPTNNFAWSGAPTDVELESTVTEPTNGTFTQTVTFTNNGPGDVDLATLSGAYASSNNGTGAFTLVADLTKITMESFSPGFGCTTVGPAAYLGAAANDHSDYSLIICFTNPPVSDVLSSGDSRDFIINYSINEGVSGDTNLYMMHMSLIADPDSSALYTEITGANDDILDTVNGSNNFFRVAALLDSDDGNQTPGGNNENSSGNTNTGSSSNSGLSNTGQNRWSLLAIALLVILGGVGSAIFLRRSKLTHQ